MITCQRPTCCRQFSGISQEQLDAVLDEAGVWECPVCGFAFDPYEEPAATAARLPPDADLADALERAKRR